MGVEMTPVDRPLIVWGIFFILAEVLHPVFFIGVLIMTFDINARYRDYLSVKDREFSRVVAYRMRLSWCSRGVAEYVWGREASDFYHIHGYRWYHVLPDGFPGVFFRASFWRHVMGMTNGGKE